MIFLNLKNLEEAKERYQSGNRQAQEIIESFLKEAETKLTGEVYSVTDKNKLPAGGDKHDYTSIGTYWWPDPDKEDGLPYIRRDGYKNPEVDNLEAFDRKRLELFIDKVNTMAVAYFYSEDIRFKQYAEKLLDTWFLNEATRMNPNLNYAQCIPGRCDGRDIGIIDTYFLVEFLDCVSLLSYSRVEELKDWMGAYLDWLLESPNGRGEDEKLNNHGLWYDGQVCALALFCGREGILTDRLNGISKKRLDNQIEEDGTLPEELARTRSFSYSLFATRAILSIASAGNSVGVDLWSYKTAKGGGIEAIFDFLTPYFLGEKDWAWEQVTEFEYASFSPYYQTAYNQYGKVDYLKVIEKLWKESRDNSMSAKYPCTINY